MNLPVAFIESARTLLGENEYKKFAAALEQEPVVSIRLNPLKMQGGETLSDCVPWASDAFYLKERPVFTFDPLFHAGCYYVQEASSMFVEQVIRQYVASPVTALDLCAAPGGKSTHLRSVLPEGSLLVANEVIRSRSQILAENLMKWGYPDVVVTNNDPADLRKLSSFFDLILTDVPCSGEGMFRKDPVAVEEWTLENVETCWQRQRRIVADIWPCLKPGGILIYSTCTYNTKEDEENVCWIRDELGGELLTLDVREEWGITGSLLKGEDIPVYHFLPHRSRGEGFFLAVLRKPCAEEEETGLFTRNKTGKKKEKKGGNTDGKVLKEYASRINRWLNNDASVSYETIINGSEICVFPKGYMNELACLKDVLRVIQAGVQVGEMKGKDLIPSHALAMCPSLMEKDAFAVEEVNYEQAIAYLRKEAITLPATAPCSYVLLTYRNIPLGFVKNIGNRANNLYPQAWRIRKEPPQDASLKKGLW